MYLFVAHSCRRSDAVLRASGTRGGLVLLGAVAMSVAVASPAAAHGIGGDAATASVPGFVSIGIEHMLLGWDHLLFVAGIVLLAGSPRRGAKVISAFVAGHSLTLVTATLAGWQVNATLVDVVIVLSVAFVGGYGMLVGRPQRWDVFTAIVFGFGLIHGLGLATRFQALGVAEDGMVWRLLAFNLGIEIGQLTAILGVVAIAGVVSMAFKNRRDAALSKAAYVALFNIGAIAAPVLAYQSFAGPDIGSGEIDVALPQGSGCTISARTEPFPAAGGGHTEKAFYGPDEDAPMDNFSHSLGDGYVVVLYPDDVTGPELDELRDFIEAGDPDGVVAGAREDTTGQVKAVTIRQELICEEVHVGALRQYSRAWMELIGATS
ncbi:MAG: HupE/UreJ family protein [Nocardioides sp.]|uniref:HupE/UreJ family protein n=1 Tax=Nocardioides sp. TaxID=35761 RepID=UPI003263EDE5